MIQRLVSEYGEMHRSRGKRHDYMGMWLDYSIPGEVRISMEEYLRGVLDDSPEEITETPETPAASNPFNVRYDNKRELLDETQSQAFHHTVAQLLFTGIQCRKKRTDGDNFPNDESQEYGRGLLEETEEIARLLKTND